LVAGVGFEGDEGQAGLYLFLEVATAHKPSTIKAIAGATIPPVVPLKKIHSAYAIQRTPTISLSFLT